MLNCGYSYKAMFENCCDCFKQAHIFTFFPIALFVIICKIKIFDIKTFIDMADNVLDWNVSIKGDWFSLFSCKRGYARRHKAGSKADPRQSEVRVTPVDFRSQ